MGVGRILGVDLGFVQTKAMANYGGKVKFPSLVKKRSSNVITGIDDAEGMVVGFEGESWNVGAKGTYDFKADRLNHNSDFVKLLAVFGSLHNYNRAGYDKVVTGLPVYEFNNYRESLRDAIGSNVHSYTFNGFQCATNAREVHVIPQSAGAFYDHVLTEDGEIADTPLASENVLVLDIGGRTTDGCIMEASKYSQESFTLFTGVWKVHQELRRLIMNSHNYTMKIWEVDEVTRTGVLTLGGKFHDIQDLVDKAVDVIFPEIWDEMSLHIEDFRRYSVVMLAGGGAHVFYNQLKAYLDTPVILMEDAEFANARGYMKYGILKARG